ncbi:gamma-glutamyl-gamma-aminobutyrate hydrolase family protein [Adlercreutzia aquisgranensis]|uniref:gamma-glutamyl-gamma-aminobutyrate hydrolase family protein n=1 Tax=Adlercreutzia aquisgranensis TaxID=2941323 RepID=UPI0020426D01|nr:gamma-glutamyl-gamma-aminobutyrate hydrolase family protein [Adlercreutzia aquisgranensis]
MIVGITTMYSEIEQPDELTRIERVAIEYISALQNTGTTVVLIPPMHAGHRKLQLESGPQEWQRIVKDKAHDQAKELVGRLDALVLSGGRDLNPALYDQDPHAETAPARFERDTLEQALARAAFLADLPTLGICRGMQMMDVALGGTLYQHVPDLAIGASHSQQVPYQETSHVVDVAPDTLLSRIFDTDSLAVNSMHHQAVDQVAPQLVPSAKDADGIVEAIEAPSKRFFLGVQWHPEYLPDHAALFTALVEACRRS